ncbi:hypothetical protein [Halalkalibacter akibai]|uniref:Uncharacterized protein n=1 Tax=Halalkalibacter akibai (strain ATCC 43226 / DSM 21942 / CIP 109018 / JCM 9157 / 1139) TaxID=1236973 RepID=W4QZI2_HALA3|nr:hypothetical protein [Halalkalibacter akibai]GAE36724.1 hypothetical protein JCM9157_3938 [Halalkalibacter akibai JCM 9157]
MFNHQSNTSFHLISDNDLLELHVKVQTITEIGTDFKQLVEEELKRRGLLTALASEENNK